MSLPPAEPGTYALVLRVERAGAVSVGRLGRLHLSRGDYVYVGSALGAGGLRARLGHHARRARRARWHVDYLRRRALLLEAWYARDPVRREHAWAAIAAGMRGASVPAPRFGASDCKCPAHLVRFARAPTARAFGAALARAGAPAAVRVWRPRED